MAQGNSLEGAVYKMWEEIWNSDTPRAYTYDFEVYGPKSQNPLDAEVEIYIAVK